MCRNSKNEEQVICRECLQLSIEACQFKILKNMLYAAAKAGYDGRPSFDDSVIEAVLKTVFPAEWNEIENRCLKEQERKKEGGI